MPSDSAYLNNESEYQTIWQLAHGWAGIDHHTSDPNNLSPEVRKGIHRVMIAIRNKLISVRTPDYVILDSHPFLDVIFYFSHLMKFTACLKKNRFDKKYLDSLYVWRQEVIRWCINDQYPTPSVWQVEPNPDSSIEDEADDKHWHEQLSPRRKGIVAALHIAARLWKDNQSLSYEEVWNHEDMIKYDKPRIFPSLDSFKGWARDIAPQQAKSPGRRKNSV